MHLTRYDDIHAFYQRAEPFLLEHEAEHNLILGITTGIIRDGNPYDADPYLAIVEEGDRVVAVTIRTPPHLLLVSRAEPAALPLIAADVRQHYATLPGILAPKAIAQPLAQEWQRHSGQPYHLGVAQRIYQLDAVVPVEGVPGRLRRATPDDRDLLVEWFVAFDIDTFGHSDRRLAERGVNTLFTATTRAIYFWDDDGPVSMAGYSGPTPHGIRIGRVYTPPELRSRG